MRATWTCACLLASSAAWGQQYLISTVAGGVAVPGFGQRDGIAADRTGNVYFGSSQLNAVFRLDAGGFSTRVAGKFALGFAGDGGPALEAQLNSPGALAVDNAGNLVIADTGNQRIRKVAADGTIVTVAGNGACCLSSDGGLATSAQLQTPIGLAIDAAGNLFIADEANHRIRKVSTSGIITTVVGTGSMGFSGDGGPAVAAQLNTPLAVAVDGAGNLFIADYGNHSVRMVSPTGTITTVAGQSQFVNGPLSLALDSNGNLLVVDYGRILRVSNGVFSTVVGGGEKWGSSADGGSATSAALLPLAVASGASGTLFLVDTFGPSNSIRKVSPDGIITTLVAAAIPCCALGDAGPAIRAQLSNPAGVALDGAGNFFIADAFNSRIRKVSSDGIITSVSQGCGRPDDYDVPCSIAADGRGNIYVADEDGVRRISPNGVSTTVWARPSYGIAIDNSGNLYVGDQFSFQIRRFSATGQMTTIAGNGACGYSGDGGPAVAAQLCFPTAFAVDGSGNLYFADEGTSVRIRRISPNGIITTIAGGSGELAGGSAANTEKLGEVIGLAVDTAGNLYFQEFTVSYPDVLSYSRRVRKMSPDGIVTTIAGTGQAGYSGDGGPALLARLNPRADERGNNLAVDGAGNVYVADGGNNAIRLLQPIDYPVISSLLDAASQRPAPVSPGKIVVIYGSGIGPSELMVNEPVDGRIGTELGGTTVSFNGIAAPIVYTSPMQVAAVAPYAITGATAQVTLAYQGKVSGAFPVDVAPSAPGIFTWNQTGSGQVLGMNVADGTVNSGANPAKIGDSISFYATGEGQTIPAGVDGKLGAGTLPQPALKVSVTIGGLPAPVQNVGGAAGQVAGLVQVTVRIPDGVQPGGYVPLELKVGDRSSSSVVWIAVAAR